MSCVSIPAFSDSQRENRPVAVLGHLLLLPFESMRTIPIKSQRTIAVVAKYAQDGGEIVFNNPPMPPWLYSNKGT